MSGTTIGGQKAYETVKARFGENHYGIIGAIGGKKGAGPAYRKGGLKAVGFAANPELAVKVGAIGGAKSRRTSAKERASRVMRHETKRKFEQGDSYYQSLLKKHGIVLD